MFVDYPSVNVQDIATEDTEGLAVAATDGYVIPLCIPPDEVATLLSQYDPAASASPSAAHSRIIARLIMDALLKATS